MSAYLTLFAMMVVAHALFDYPLQGDFLSKAKNRANPIPGVPWYQAMAAHSIIQGGAVWFLTLLTIRPFPLLVAGSANISSIRRATSSSSRLASTKTGTSWPAPSPMKPLT